MKARTFKNFQRTTQLRRFIPTVRAKSPVEAPPKLNEDFSKASTDFVEAELDGGPGSKIRMEASTKQTRCIQELEKPILEYMTLPASQYSVLDGAQVERLTDDTFRVTIASFSFFGFEIQPIMTVAVRPRDNGCQIEMMACKLAGSPAIESQNSKFSARMRNLVSCQPGTEPGTGELMSTVGMTVDVVKPGWFVVPNAAIKTAGNAVMNTILSAAVPRFLAQLEKDYRVWSSGDDSREALGTGEML